MPAVSDVSCESHMTHAELLVCVYCRKDQVPEQVW